MLLQYKCPNCGDDMSFDSDSGTLLCPSCDRQEKIEDYNDDYVTRAFAEEDAVEYQCNNCGAAVITDKDTTATSCSFCSAGVVIGDRLTGKLAPGKVIPFTISKEEARKTFKKWCKNGWFTPKGFMNADRIKNITGMYIPYWIYDLNSKVKVDAIGTRVRKYTKGDWEYTETKYYDIYRDIDLYYNRVPADASEKLNDGLMDLVEPYHYKDLKEFKTPYLAGYLAEKYNFNADELFPRIKGKVSPFISSYINSTISGYSSVRDRKENIDTKSLNSTYVLFPVWMVYYDFEHQEHTFLMNGQTGKVVGKAPISKSKIALWSGSLAAASFLIIKIATFITGGVLW